jgi:mycofactocin precursor
LFLAPGDITLPDIRHTVTNIVKRAEGATMTEKIATPAEPADVPAAAVQDEVLAEDLLVEEVSIDGMCGVY